MNNVPRRCRCRCSKTRQPNARFDQSSRPTRAPPLFCTSTRRARFRPVASRCLHIHGLYRVRPSAPQETTPAPVATPHPHSHPVAYRCLAGPGSVPRPKNVPFRSRRRHLARSGARVTPTLPKPTGLKERGRLQLCRAASTTKSSTRNRARRARSRLLRSMARRTCRAPARVPANVS